MRIDGTLPPTNPYHIARAYGVQGGASAASVRPVQNSAATQSVQSSEKQPSAAQRLVAAVVPGRVDFSGATPQPGVNALQMYRHPAERNAAATGVMLGRSLDVSG